MSGEWMGDPYAAQLRADKAEGELAAVMDALRDFAEYNGLNPEMEPRDLLAKATGAFRSCAAMSDARYTEIQELRAEMEAMRPRLMPEGMEWLLEVWPKWSNGEYCKFGDWWTADKYGDYEPKQLRRLVFYTPEQLREWEQDEGDNFGYEWDFMRPSDTTYRPDKAEPPAPKVLDADGVEILEKCDVWWICEGDERGVHAERLRVETIGSNGLIECSPYNGGTWVYLEPSELYVNKPVLAADGRPLREGEMVWFNDEGHKIGFVANGEPLKVLGLRGKRMVGVLDQDDIAKGYAIPWWFAPSCFTHERPDSWERVMADAESIDRDLRGFDGDVSTCADLVRRAKALAERERGQ